MTEVILSCESLGKKYYKINKSSGRYVTIRESIANKINDFIRNRKALVSCEQNAGEFWAIRNINLEVCKGDVVGIIGKNGAGKSTLLKILSKITPPSEGCVYITGRIVSLLEVGAGFHPELTGRENIYMNASILGMKKKEVDKCFEKIVEFAEVKDFLDVPVKRYSSGMYVRLAFSVAAHLNPEILILDEVLAVGDVHFQNKCIERIKEVATAGNTVLLVSHNMASVLQFCNKGVLLSGGTVKYSGSIKTAVNLYLQELTSAKCTDLRTRYDRKGNQDLKIIKVVVANCKNEEVSTVLSGENIVIRFYYESIYDCNMADVNIAFNVINSRGIIMTHLNTVDINKQKMNIYNSGYFECIWSKLCLRADIYVCTVFCQINGDIVDWINSAFILHVEDGDFYNTGRLISREQGEILVDYNWTSSSF